MVAFSVLDLAPIVEGGGAAQTFRNCVDLAQHAERWGFRRFWLAEHHGMPGIASAATSVLIGHVARETSTIRVGAGGIMLPNHSPLVIAEQFGTLEALYPGRIDLGLGRAPGSDQITARALRRTLVTDPNEFPRDVVELMGYFAPRENSRTVRAVPGEGLKIPIWILGSSLFGARVAAELGLPFAFASHFAPGQMMQALETYRAHFTPSESLARPYAMLGFNIFAADTDEEGAFLASSMQQAFISLRSGHPSRVRPPVKDYLGRLSPAERDLIEQTLWCSAIGSPDTVRRQLTEFIGLTKPDELMMTSHIYDHAARLHSLEIAASVMKGLSA